MFIKKITREDFIKRFVEQNKKKPAEAKTPQKVGKKKTIDTKENKTPKLESSSYTKNKGQKFDFQEGSGVNPNKINTLDKDSKDAQLRIKEIAQEDVKELNLRNTDQQRESTFEIQSKLKKNNKESKRRSPKRRKKVLNQKNGGGSCCTII